MTTRRQFVEQSAALAAVAALPRRAVSPGRPSLDLSDPPASVIAQTATGDRALRPTGAGHWEADGIVVTVTPLVGGAAVSLASPATPIKRIGLRWPGALASARLILGDAWERGYGDLEWRGFVPDRVMPWYVAAWDGSRTDCYGVKTGARAFCSWELDPEGLGLWCDVRSGGVAVELGERTLEMCAVTSRAGRDGESAWAALHEFCGSLCEHPRLPVEPVYGHNDWYWAYGKNSAESVLADARRIVELSPAGSNRPYAVIDDGWQPERGADKVVGAWDRGNEKFPDMARLASDVRQAGARPGIWIRPLLAPATAPDGWRSARERRMLDPTVNEVREKVAADIARLTQWGFALIKHDYTTFDIFGRWGSQMGAALTKDGWTFAEGPRRTTAEVIGELYATIARAGGDALVIGCNTVSHLSAGQFQLCRVGDDTSGTEWARTRRMGVNTLAFRGVQQGTFYAADADCVGVTTNIPWDLNRQWLDLLSRSGTPLFVSLAPDAVGAREREDLTAALARAAQPQRLGEPLDWQRTVWPRRWSLSSGARSYDWGSVEPQ